MIERGKHIRFPLKILDNRLAHKRIRSSVDHFLNRHQLHHIRKVQITGTINRPHAADTDHILNVVPVNKRNARLKLLAGARIIL